MPVTTSRLFDFLDKRSACSIGRYEIASAVFGDLRRSLRQIIVSLSESDEWDGIEIAARLRAALSEWLTVPVRFDDKISLALLEMGEAESIESRWGSDIRRHFQDACFAAKELSEQENPVRTKLRELILEMSSQGWSFRIFCNRRDRGHFESLFPESNTVLSSANVFLHTVVDYRDAEPFDVLLKVGPLRSKGWSSAPDALLTAPRFSDLVQVVWSGCSDESGFGYDPLSVALYQGDEKEDCAITDRYSRSLNLAWSIHEHRSGDSTIGLNERLSDYDELQFFATLPKPIEVQPGTLVQISEKFGILYPPHSRVLGFDSVTNATGFRVPGETLLEGMFLILPIVEDIGASGLQAEEGHFSTIWKSKLIEEYLSGPDSFLDRLRDAGLDLRYLRGRIEHWCKPATTVIHAPQSLRHFEILIKVLGIDFGPNQVAQRSRGAWWEYAWSEIRRSRGEAIQVGFQEQQIVDEQLLEILNALDEEIQANLHQSTFQLQIPPGHAQQGVFRVYKVLAVEGGFIAPPGEFRTISELSRIDQWRG